MRLSSWLPWWTAISSSKSCGDYSSASAWEAKSFFSSSEICYCELIFSLNSLACEGFEDRCLLYFSLLYFSKSWLINDSYLSVLRAAKSLLSKANSRASFTSVSIFWGSFNDRFCSSILLKNCPLLWKSTEQSLFTRSFNWSTRASNYCIWG